MLRERVSRGVLKAVAQMASWQLSCMPSIRRLRRDLKWIRGARSEPEVAEGRRMRSALLGRFGAGGMWTLRWRDLIVVGRTVKRWVEKGRVVVQLRGC